MTLSRTTPLRRTRDIARAKAALRRTGPLRQLGNRALREAKDRAAFMRAVLGRAGGRFGVCERCGRDCARGGYRLEAHHRHPKSHAPLSYRNNPWRNGAALCHRNKNAGRSGCHERVHDHAVPDWALWVGSGAVRDAEGRP